MSAAARYRIEVKPVVGGKWRQIGIDDRTAVDRIVWANVEACDRKLFGLADRRELKPTRWARARGLRIRIVEVDPYPFLMLDDDTYFGSAELARRVNNVGRRLGVQIFAREFLRTRAQQQAFWDAFIARGKQPPLVAYPGTSKHETGRAMDAGVRPVGTTNTVQLGINIANYPGARAAMRAEGLCCPVPGEPWHVEIGTHWAV